MSNIHWRGEPPYTSRTGIFPIRTYPSGEPIVGFSGLEQRSLKVQRLLLRPASMVEFMGGLFFADALRERGQASRDLELILPFVPGARQDRLNDAGDYLFTAKSVAREVNARNFARVTIIDPHSEVTPALLDRCRVIHAHEVFDPALVLERYVAVISPDAGAEKRAGGVAKKWGLPLLHGWKTRDVATGTITGFGLEPSPLTGKMIVIDDICDGGRTFIGLAEVFKSRGITADLYTSHGIYSQGVDALLNHYETLYCTDSIEVERPRAQRVDVISTCSSLFTEPSC